MHQTSEHFVANAHADMGNAQLQEVKTKGDLKQVLSDFANENRTSQWVVGRGIKYGIVSTRHELDAILADRPVYIGAFDGHTGWANTKALEMAGILTPGGSDRRRASGSCRRWGSGR